MSGHFLRGHSPRSEQASKSQALFPSALPAVSPGEFTLDCYIVHCGEWT